MIRNRMVGLLQTGRGFRNGEEWGEAKKSKI